MGRKVFISVLGTGMYEPCKYVSTDFKSSETRFIQQATLEYLGVNDWVKTDVALFVLTEGARKLNWDVKERYDFKKKKDTVYIGLKYVLEDMNLPFVSTLSIPDGKDESEMWEIFQKIFDVLHDGDELYFDLTHSFRYLPMLVLVLGNYAKFLKHVMIKFITYGNFEARNELNEAPIVDLLPLSNLQDWTFAAGQYLDDGNVNKLVQLSKDVITPILKKTKGQDDNATKLRRFIDALNLVVEERRTCRGISIIKSDNFKKMKDASKQIDSTFIKPFNPVIDKIKDSLDDFDDQENVTNGFSAAKWCLHNGLYQQAATILHENIITTICMKMNYAWEVEDQRNIVNVAFKVAIDDIKEDKWDLKLKSNATDEEKRQRISDIRATLQNDLLIALVNDFRAINDLRNDYNHSGIRNNPMSPSTLISKIEKRINSVLDIVTNYAN